MALSRRLFGPYAVEENGLRPDLILTDVIMPGMSGDLLIKRLQKNQPDLRVLFMSGYTDDIIATHGVLDENIQFIHKPFEPDTLAGRIRGLLRKATDQ